MWPAFVASAAVGSLLCDLLIGRTGQKRRERVNKPHEMDEKEQQEFKKQAEISAQVKAEAKLEEEKARLERESQDRKEEARAEEKTKLAEFEALQERMKQARKRTEAAAQAELQLAKARVEREAREKEEAALAEPKKRMAELEAESHRKVQEEVAKRAADEKERRRKEAEEYPRPKYLGPETEGEDIWAMFGDPGSGKSSMINMIVGSHVAPVGSDAPTLEPTCYKIGGPSGQAIWDLPGAGTLKFPCERYVAEMGLRHFDLVFLVSSGRWKEHDLKVIEQLHKHKVRYFVIRSKVDLDIANEEMANKKDAATTLRELRADAADHGIEEHRLFLCTADRDALHKSESLYDIAKLAKAISDLYVPVDDPELKDKRPLKKTSQLKRFLKNSMQKVSRLFFKAQTVAPAEEEDLMPEGPALLLASPGHCTHGKPRNRLLPAALTAFAGASWWPLRHAPVLHPKEPPLPRGLPEPRALPLQGRARALLRPMQWSTGRRGR